MVKGRVEILHWDYKSSQHTVWPLMLSSQGRDFQVLELRGRSGTGWFSSGLLSYSRETGITSSSLPHPWKVKSSKIRLNPIWGLFPCLFLLLWKNILPHKKSAWGERTCVSSQFQVPVHDCGEVMTGASHHLQHHIHSHKQRKTCLFTCLFRISSTFPFLKSSESPA